MSDPLCQCGHPESEHMLGYGCTGRFTFDNPSDECPCRDFVTAVFDPPTKDRSSETFDEFQARTSDAVPGREEADFRAAVDRRRTIVEPGVVEFSYEPTPPSGPSPGAVVAGGDTEQTDDLLGGGRAASSGGDSE